MKQLLIAILVSLSIVVGLSLAFEASRKLGAHLRENCLVVYQGDTVKRMCK